MDRRDRTCVACGKNYKYCPQCKEDQDRPTWLFVWDCEECRNVFNIVTRFNMGTISKEEAKTQLDQVYTHEIKFNEDVEKGIAKICEEEKPQVKPKRKRIVTED